MSTYLSKDRSSLYSFSFADGCSCPHLSSPARDTAHIAVYKLANSLRS
jgi:hypothetical protein